MINKDKNENTVTITRKYALIPTSSERKEWHKRVYNFTIEDLTRKIEYYKFFKRTKSICFINLLWKRWYGYSLPNKSISRPWTRN